MIKALIRLSGCAGWSAPFLFANPEDRFSRAVAQLFSFSFKVHKSQHTLENVLYDYICRHNQHLVATFKMQTDKIIKMY